ncbi:hypothetical protein PAI11_30620 [Patulibacter medicamentivorans]|uniref:Uncharacterized protein n=1 Tax=Patulibacter medicamentivorans TaxID=1097667 RepID=H0E8A1_9ACTN|nr:hypothetical protein PAI11_30620 [Patulibacter medicamentivorans]
MRRGEMTPPDRAAWPPDWCTPAAPESGSRSLSAQRSSGTV